MAEGERKITVEMKSVNHRYLDVNIKMPKKLNFFEAAIRNELKNYIQRGKVDIFITYEDLTESNVCVKYNRELAAEYVKYLSQMAEDFSLDNDIRVSTLSRYPEVFSMEEQTIDEEELWLLLDKAIKGAAEGFVQTRIRSVRMALMRSLLRMPQLRWMISGTCSSVRMPARMESSRS